MSTYYINADTGNDSTGTGASGAPWLTFSKAHAEAADGDTVVAQDSVAQYQFAATTLYDFTKSLTLVGEQDDASGAVFSKPTGTGFWNISAVGVSGKAITIQKVTFTNIRTGATYGGAVGVPLFQVSGPDTVFTLDRCVIHDIETLSSFSIGGIVSARNGNNAAGSIITVQSCIMYNIVEFLNTPPSGAGTTSMLAIRQANSAILNIFDNTILLSAGHGFGYMYAVGVSTANIAEKGNLIKDASGVVQHSILSGGITGQVSYDNNHNGFLALPGFVTGEPTNLTSDPAWVDEANFNFNLAPGSSAIDSRRIE